MFVVLKKTGDQPKPDMSKVFKRLKSQSEFGHDKSTNGKNVSFL